MGKPFNCAKASKKDLYAEKNVELALLQSALNIEDGVEGLRYNNIVIATDVWTRSTTSVVLPTTPIRRPVRCRSASTSNSN